MSRWVWICFLVALVIRVGAASGLPLDADEPVYLRSAERVATLVRSGHLAALQDQPHNPEHPVLIKAVHGLALLGVGEAASSVERLAAVRGVEILGGATLAGLMATVHPAAGVATAMHGLHAKYTAQGYLEAWPMVAMALGLVAWGRLRRAPTLAWSVAVGAAIGVAAAGKLVHALPGLVLIVWTAARHPRLLLPMVSCLGATALVLDPGLWLDPWGRMWGRLAHHSAYLGDVSTPWWSPLEALAGGLSTRWHPSVFVVPTESLIAPLGLWGLLAAVRAPGPRQPLAAAALSWLILCLGFLLLWPTRWAQHSLVVLVPLCLGCGFWAERTLSRASRRFAPTETHPPAGG